MYKINLFTNYTNVTKRINLPFHIIGEFRKGSNIEKKICNLNQVTTSLANNYRLYPNR